MTIIFSDSDRRRRKKLSAPKAANSYPVAGKRQASQSSKDGQPQTYASSPWIAEPAPAESGYPRSPPQYTMYSSPSPPQPGYIPPSQESVYSSPPTSSNYASPAPPQQGFVSPPHAPVHSSSSPPQQGYAPPSQASVYSNPPPAQQGYFQTQQYHPIYGPTPQMSPQYGSPYMAPPAQYGQPYIGNSSVSIATAPLPKEKDGFLRSHWNRAERLASRSCQDLSAQLSSGANKSVNMVNRSLDKSVAMTGKSLDKSIEVTNKSVTMVATNYIERPTALISKKSVQALNQGAALCDRIGTKLDAVITSIDGGMFSGKEQDLLVEEEPIYQSSSSSLQPEPSTDRSMAMFSNGNRKKNSNVFSKVWLYSNSRLPPHLPPFKVYMPTYPLLCLAAAYSERVYTPTLPTSQTESHIPADWRSGTKAMVLKSLPVDDMNTIVFAIRGSQTFMDWAVNYRSDPSSPEGFLDDAGNYCHAGFLQVARKMIKPVAERLRVLLEENPARSNASLLITGHSAGGAVAALLYAHMMSTQVQSELRNLTDFFKRVHCVTFGAPPVSLLPLKKSDEKRHRKSLFYSFINEGDPVPRADKAFVKSLLKLYSSAAPAISSTTSALVSMSKLNLSENTSQSTLQTTTSSQPPKPSRKNKKSSKASKTSLQTTSASLTTVSSAPSWSIPPCTLSPAGRLVVLRQRIGGKGEDDVEAVTVEDDMLRAVVYGDPLKHMMKVYRKRIEEIATRAVTASDY